MSSLADPLDSTSINLTSEDLEEVPLDDIVKYPQVLYVDLSINSIRTLSLDFAPRLSNIIHLDLSKNCLEKLPANFGQLNNLQHLDLYSNKIQSLPVSMAKMTKLIWLDMKDNPINCCLKEVVGEFWNADECKAAAKNIVFFMSQVRMFITNVKDFEYQNVHSFTLKTNPFSNLIERPSGFKPKESFQNSTLKSDNDNAEIQIWNANGPQTKYWNLMRRLTVWICLFFAVLFCVMVFGVVLYGPRTIESCVSMFGSRNGIDNFIVRSHKYIQSSLTSWFPVFPLLKDTVVEEVPVRSWYQILPFYD